MKVEDTLASNVLTLWKVVVAIRELGQVLDADVQEASALSHRPCALDTMAQRQLFVDGDHCALQTP